MKFTLGIFLIFFVGALAQDETVTDGFIRAQGELSLTHEFFETTLFLNRGQISSYLYRINREIITSHIDTYAFIKTRGIDALAEINAIPETPNNAECLGSLRNRWDLQVTRYGHRLATCVNNAYRLLRGWNEFLNNLHAIGQVAGNQVQNLGVKVLSETEIFDGRNQFPVMINRELRILLKVFLSYRDLFDGFLDEISEDYLNTIRDLIECDQVLEREFEAEIEVELNRAQNCAALDNTAEQKAVPL
ncbi:CLUMA_CG009647, isoform A [Clunio marinus]|uniref:CLUMA_CG009647, isoform A n=1 Tax=Clunio marinus TaxID=568069 RepID=A0A1J1I9H1_9DIPT|nr:CLUMA_CG009647, isoform A [Clunio marinus]